MRSILVLLLTFFALTACKHADRNEETESEVYKQVVTDEYQLEFPTEKPDVVLMLFGGYPEVASDIRREFKILEPARKHNIAIVYFNYNQKLWFEENELSDLANQVQAVFSKHDLPTEHVFIGGFSSGGNVSLLLSNYLKGNQASQLVPEGVFIVDSPIDLAALYMSSEKNVARKFSEVSVNESTWLLEQLGGRFGNPHEDLTAYKKHSVFTLATGSIDNLQNLKDTKIRMYTEPDTAWWKEHRMADYEQTNAYLIKELAERLEEEEFAEVEYIATENQGYRANGERHPHSWAIIETEDLIAWILKK